MHRIKINTISSKVESFEQRKDTMDKVDEERKYQIDVRPILTELFCCLGMGFPGVYCASNERQKEVVAQWTNDRGNKAIGVEVPAGTHPD